MRSVTCLRHSRFVRASSLVIAAALLAGGSMASAASNRVGQTNLVTDDQSFLTGLGFDPAANVDPHLINPWGMSSGPTSPFWVSNQGDNTATIYNGAGAVIPLVVSIPHAASGPIGPTGQVFNGSSSFALASGGKGFFFFANLDGSISGWNPAQGTTAAVVVPGGSAAYTGLAIGNTGGNDYLYAANRVTGGIDVFNGSFAPTTLAGNFTDPGANPDGLVPFNVRNLGGHLFVTYSIPGPDADEAALGQGFVSEFDLNGNFIRRVADGGNLLSPWGLEIAPSTFGAFAGALLVGNFSDEDGFINAFRLSDGAFLGSLHDLGGSEVNIPYLWGLQTGNGGAGGNIRNIYFTSGIGDEAHGLFGTFNSVPEPGQWAMMLVGFGAMGTVIRRNRRKVATAV